MDNRKKLISLFVPTLGGGGAERIMLELAKGFSAHSFAVDLILVQAKGPYLKEVPATVRIINLKSSRVLFSFTNLFFYLRREKPYALISALDHANVISLLAGKLSGLAIRLVVTEHNTVSNAYAESKDLRARWILRFMCWLYPWAKSIVAVSQGVAEDLAATIGLAPNRITVIYNPVISSRLAHAMNSPVKHTWFSLGQPPVILGVGRLTPQKDFSTLIHAFAQLKKTHLARLMILGEGEERKILEQLIHKLNLENDVSLPGFVSNPHFYMKHSALFVLSSRWEGLPTVLIEAMAAGSPIVATDCPSGPAEILENGRWGRLVPVRDINALAIAMAQTLDEITHPDVAARAADFSVDQAVGKYLEILDLK